MSLDLKGRLLSIRIICMQFESTFNFNWSSFTEEGYILLLHLQEQCEKQTIVRKDRTYIFLENNRFEKGKENVNVNRITC